MKNAYEAITEITNGNDVIIPLNVSDFCAVFDLRQTKASRQQLLDDVVEWLKKNQNGIKPKSRIR